MPDRRDPVIVLRGKPRDTVFLRVHFHAAELDDPEFTAALRASHLFIENRSVVIRLDHNRRNEKERRSNDQKKQRADNINDPLPEALAERQRVLPCHVKRRIEQVHLERSLDQHIRDLRHHVDTDAVRVAGLDELVAERCRDIPENNAPAVL